MIEVAVTHMDRLEAPFAAGVAARGMCDNPNPRAAFGPDRLTRLRNMQRLFGVSIPSMTCPPLVARRGDHIVGVCGMAPPGMCQGTPATMLRMLPGLVMIGPAAALRAINWMNKWKALDPKERHWHLGPVAVEPGLQGMTVGSQMLERFCAHVDALGEMAYLETEKPENVRLYERFGFVTVAEAEVIGCHNWFMRREPREK